MTWNVDIRSEGANYVTKNQLSEMVLKHDGQEILRADATGNVVSVELVANGKGEVVDVRGANEASATITALAKPENRGWISRTFSPEHIRALTAARFEAATQDIIGRPTATGSTWNIPGGSVVKNKTVSVVREEPCGKAKCVRLRMTYDVNPVEAAALVDIDVKAFAMANGVDPTKVTTTNTTYSIQEMVLIEPNTMLGHGATAAEQVKTTIIAPSGQFDLVIKSSTEHAYDYSTPAVATLSPDTRFASE